MIFYKSVECDLHFFYLSYIDLPAIIIIITTIVIILLLLLSLLLHFDSDLKLFLAHGLFDIISPKSIYSSVINFLLSFYLELQWPI